MKITIETKQTKEIEISIPCYKKFYDWQMAILNEKEAWMVKPKEGNIQMTSVAYVADHEEDSTKEDFDKALNEALEIIHSKLK
jgi:hypothetical protein